MTQTQNDQTALPIPTQEEIYDAIMGGIEPDLLTAAIPLLDEKYANEQAAEKEARLARYKAAYQAYDVAYTAWIKELHQHVSDYRKQAFRSAESDNKVIEEEHMKELESTFATATPPPAVV